MTTYPLTLPALNKIQKVTLRRIVVAGANESPFTLQRQVQLYSGERWEADVSLVPMKARDVAAWNAFFMSLDGPVGTFLMGDPARVTPFGSAGNVPGTPVANGAGQIGQQLAIKGLPHSVSGYLKAGDYLQLGSGATTRLFMAVQDVTSNSSGNATVQIRPGIKTPTVDGEAVTVTNARGIWALTAPQHEWSTDNTGFSTITFGVKEPR